MQTRSRAKTSTFTGSRTERYGSHVTNTNSYISLSESCVDVTGDGAGDNQPLTVTRTTRSGGLINGIEASTLSGYIWNDYPCAYVEDSYLTTHLSIPGQPSDGSLATQALARTQPYRAEAVAWEYLENIPQLGSSARDLYRYKLNQLERLVPAKLWRSLDRAAKLNLLYQFGIAPLISDIGTLLHFQKSVDNRVKEIERLYGKRGLRRTLQMWDGSNTTTIASQTIQSQGVLLHARITKTTTVSVRCHVRWRAIFPIQPSDAAMRNRAKRAILGADIDPYVVYELMPWSWLVDYFFNLGSLVKAAKNLTTVTHDTVRVMEHYRTWSSSSNHDTNGSGANKITCSPFSVSFETKKRRLAIPTLNAQESLLTGGQLSILGSLVVLNAK